MKKPGGELEFARGYTFVFPSFGGGHESLISDDCPADIRKKVLEVWPIIEKETMERHKNGIYLESDYFFD